MEDGIRIMGWLFEYTYLSLYHLEMLGFTKSKKTIYRILKSLRERNLIKSISYKYSPSDGKLEDVHFLTPKGYRYMNEYLGEEKKEQKIKIHKGFYEDYDHRKKTIAIKIAMQFALRNEYLNVDEYCQYFEKGQRHSKSRQRATRINVHEFFLLPDSIIKISFTDTSKLFCLEYHKGYRIKKIEKQIKQYVLAIAAGTPSFTFNVESNAIVLLVFEKESSMHETIERISKNNYYDNFLEFFLFKTYDDLLKSPLIYWTNLKNQKISIGALLKQESLN